jgi:hypothetical protein
MNATVHPQPLLAQQTQALLDLVEADRARQCAQALDEATQAAAAVRAQAHAAARQRMRLAFAELRERRRERLAAAQAGLATQRRLHEQQRSMALLHLAWQQLPGELQALWQQDTTRAAWVAHTVATARARVPPAAQHPWRIAHAPDWPQAERQALVAALQAEWGQPPVLHADAAIAAGLRIESQGNVIDGTLAALLADRADIESRLLRKLEGVP